MTINGKRVVFRGRTESEINKKILNYNEAEEKGRNFAEVAELWKEEHFKTLAFNSLKNYKPAYERIYAHFHEDTIKSITANQVKSFIVSVASKGYAQKTMRTQLLVTNLIFAKAVVDGDIEYNPAEYVKIPKNLAKKKRDIPDDAAITAVKEGVDKTFGFMLYTGCRRGESLALQWKDINFETNEITISKSVYFDNNAPKIKCPKTDAGTRTIILLDKLKTVLKCGKPNEYIFSWSDGSLLTQSQFERSWRTYCNETGLSITPHQLRHAFATILYEAGIDEKDAQEMLGHNSIVSRS